MQIFAKTNERQRQRTLHTHALRRTTVKVVIPLAYNKRCRHMEFLGNNFRAMSTRDMIAKHDLQATAAKFSTVNVQRNAADVRSDGYNISNDKSAKAGSVQPQGIKRKTPKATKTTQNGKTRLNVARLCHHSDQHTLFQRDVMVSILASTIRRVASRHRSLWTGLRTETSTQPQLRA